MTHIMLDLETWGTEPGNDIRSIGACVFDPVRGYIAIPSGDENNDAKSFYVATDNPIVPPWNLQHRENEEMLALGGAYRRYHLTRNSATVKWWSEQTPEAQAAFANPIDLREALIAFAVWLESVNPENPVPRYPDEVNGPEVRIWANDPHFDCSILAAAYRAVGLPVPWHYRSPRSMKTITEAAGMTSDDYSNYGEAHNALDDAIAQAMTVCEAYKRLGLQR